MKDTFEKKIAAAAKDLFGESIDIDLTRPDEQFGDFATNAALQLAKRQGLNPRETAEKLAMKLRETLAGEASEVSVAGPGFINITLDDKVLVSAMDTKSAQILSGKVVVAEYSDPNPFKILHAGHLYTTIVGNAVGNLLEVAGAKLHRVNFGGDVGLHVAKTMWSMLRNAGDAELDEAAAREHVAEMANRLLPERVAEIAVRYVEGNQSYEDDNAAREQIMKLNERIYELHARGDRESDFAKVYWACRDWSYEYFKAFYEQLGVQPFEKFYPESETAPLGVKTVKTQLEKGVYQKSDGAVVFKGEPYGLHTRVFINSQGLPTYEGKDVGLIMKKWDDYHFDVSVVITGNDIVEYMKVVLKSIEQFQPELVKKSRHLTHGQVKLEGGTKMSSRQGNVLYADDILEAAENAAEAINAEATLDTAYSAVKYSLLKQRLGGDIIYDPKESVALEGNSGPYLQYAYARARSILRKAGESEGKPGNIGGLDKAERSLVRKIGEYPEVVDKSVQDLMPHHICGYLYELAQIFNRFYEQNKVLGDPRQDLRLGLVSRYAGTLKSGLKLLGIAAPDKM